MRKSRQSLNPGTLLDGRYRIEKLIGSGGMGEVYQATHVSIGRRVAIKCLHSVYSDSKEAVERFQREAQLAGSIGHDNICEVTDLGTTPEQMPFLVMPLLKGCSLGDLLASPKPIAVARLVDILCQTLSALKAAHDVQIVHRDLKPDNIFVSKFGDREDFVKLLDFGISKILDQDSVSTLTRTGTVVGTPNYMSPEQAKGAKDIDHLVDIYAVGVILYEGLTGKLPFDGDSYNEVMFKIVTEPFVAPDILNPLVPPVLNQIVLKSMSRHPPARYQSADQMREALERAMVDSSIPTDAVLTSSATAVVEGEPFTPTQAKAIATPSSRFETHIRDSVPDSGLSSSGISAFLNARSKRRNMLFFFLGLGIVLIGLVFALFKLGQSEEPEEVQIVTPAPVQAAEEAAKSELQESKPVVATGIEPPAIQPAVRSPSPAKKKTKKPRRSSANRKTTPSESKSESTPHRPQPSKKKLKEDDDVVKGRFGTEFVFD